MIHGLLVVGYVIGGIIAVGYIFIYLVITFNYHKNTQACIRELSHLFYCFENNTLDFEKQISSIRETFERNRIIIKDDLDHRNKIRNYFLIAGGISSVCFIIWDFVFENNFIRNLIGF